MTLLTDYDTVAHLDNGWHAVTVTCDACGDQMLILLNPDGGPLDLMPPAHEQVGPLPGFVVAALETVRCGGRRRDGRRCRSPVAEPGDKCHWHQRQLNCNASSEHIKQQDQEET